jgi:hypothetical protein
MSTAGCTCDGSGKLTGALGDASTERPEHFVMEVIG